MGHPEIALSVYTFPEILIYRPTPRKANAVPTGATPQHPPSERKNPPSRQKQLQIITLRWRTIELETEKDQKGRRLEDASSRHIEKKQSATPPPSPSIPPYRIPANSEIKNSASFLDCDLVKISRTVGESAV